MDKKITPIERAHELAQENGFIYAVLNIILRDYNVSSDSFNELEIQERLIPNEIQFLLGLWMRYGMSMSKPESLNHFISINEEIPLVMNDIHEMFRLKLDKSKIESVKSVNDFWRTVLYNKESMIEGQFYAGKGSFDKQFLHFVTDRYEFDKKWLLENKKIDVSHSVKFVTTCMEMIHRKMNKIGYFEYYKQQQRIESKIEAGQQTELSPVKEEFCFRYKSFFSKEDITNDTLFSHNIRLGEFCNKLFEVFCVDSIDSISDNELSFLDAFSCNTTNEYNEDFKELTDFNQITKTPLIKHDGKYMIPLPSLLPKAIYETPYYWMMDDGNYINTFKDNTGNSTEIIVEKLFNRVFKNEQIKRGVTIRRGKNQVSDIDVLVIHGSTALCVQVKAKKVTVKAKSGDLEALKRDFDGIVQKAYSQGKKCAEALKEKEKLRFFVDGKDVSFPTEIKNIYVMCVSSENIQGLPFLNKIMLEKYESDAYPHVMTIFDLELITRYLTKPYLVFDYIKNRVVYNDKVDASSEQVLLGYYMKFPFHEEMREKKTLLLQNDLAHDLSKAALQDDINGKNGISVNWLDDRYLELIDMVNQHDSPAVESVIEYMLRLNIRIQVELMDYTQEYKKSARFEPTRFFNLSLHDRDDVSKGLTIAVCNQSHKLHIILKQIVEKHNYIAKAKWIGLGFCNENLVVMHVGSKIWVYDEEMDRLLNYHTTGRNEQCPCESGKKYKNCHGKGK